MTQQEIISTIDNLFNILCVKHRKTLATLVIRNYDDNLSVYYERYCKTHHITSDYDNSLVSDNEIITADIQLLLEELKHVYQLLEEKGVSKEMVHRMLTQETRNSLIAGERISTLTIDSNGKIHLPEFSQYDGNHRYKSKIVLTPLQLALYILFLKHPEGIILKEIGNYTKELEQLLRTAMSLRISNNKSSTLNEARINKLIQSVTNPVSPTIHECISRIKHTFKTKLGDSACHYYISGIRGSVYNIELARDIVTIADVWL